MFAHRPERVSNILTAETPGLNPSFSSRLLRIQVATINEASMSLRLHPSIFTSVRLRPLRLETDNELPTSTSVEEHGNSTWDVRTQIPQASSV